MKRPLDKDFIEILAQREGVGTEVVLRDGRRLNVLNIACGYDDGDGYAHVTTNVSPSLPDASVDFFHTDQVATVIDPLTAVVLFEPGW